MDAQSLIMCPSCGRIDLPYNVRGGNCSYCRLYDLVSADPAWHFSNWSADAPGQIHDRERGANKHYVTSSLETMMMLRVKERTTKDAVLLMWVLPTHMEEAFALGRAWGFKPVTRAWTWVKTVKDGSRPRMGMGYWTRHCSEDCWLFTKGHPSAPAFRGEPAIIEEMIDDQAPEWDVVRDEVVYRIGDTLYAPRPAVHSQKPIEQYEKIDRLFPHLTRRLEMFARSAREGWDVWGNEAPGSIVL
jgi:N6-adenosine-specific RNA methylase IME4